MTNEIEEAFITFWGCYYGHEYQPSDLKDNEVLRAFKEGHKAGAEAKVIQLSWDYDQILKDKDKERFESILAERARVLGEVRKCIRALKNGWTTSEVWGRAVIDTCELLEHRLKEGRINERKPMKKTNLTFGEALEALKQGERIQREGWNGLGMFLFLLPAGHVPKTAIYDPKLREVIDAEVEGETFECLESIRMFTADKKVLTGWLASQTDMLSEDWRVL
jgi:hypothetical protein